MGHPMVENWEIRLDIGKVPGSDYSREERLGNPTEMTMVPNWDWTTESGYMQEVTISRMRRGS